MRTHPAHCISYWNVQFMFCYLLAFFFTSNKIELLLCKLLRSAVYADTCGTRETKRITQQKKITQTRETMKMLYYMNRTII